MLTCSPPTWVCGRNMASAMALVPCVMLILLTAVAATTYEQFVLTDGTGPLQRMVQDESTGSIYLGSVNGLYKLSSQLVLESENVTGPVEDNQMCRPPPHDCPHERTNTDNVNKALIVDRERNQLITCGSIYQGFCQVLRLDDMSFITEPDVEVVTNTEQGTNVAFIGPGPSGSTNLLYTAASRGEWIREVPTVSKRKLDGPSQLSLIADVKIPQNTFDETQSTNIFDINYLYGFASGTFSYFIATQIRDFRAVASPLYTKIVRLCQNDESTNLNSYIELPLVCSTSDGDGYNLAKSAYVTKVGSDLINAGITQGEDVLFVTFSTPDTLEPRAPKSVVCMYPIKMINEWFLSRIRDCANQVTDSTEIDWLGSSGCLVSPIVIEKANSSGANYCHTTDVNSPLGGLHPPIKAEDIYASNSTLTAIAATPHNEATVVLIGDEYGNLKKLRVQSLTKAELYEEVSVASGSAVVQNGLMFDKDEQYVYFMTGYKITRVPIETCELLTTCSDCLAAGGQVGDPHCGWCTLQTSCTRRSEDECQGYLLTNRWIDSHESCINVESVQPPSIPSHTKSELTLNITSLPLLYNNSRYECVFGDLGSTPASQLDDSSLVKCQTPDMSSFQGGSLSVPLSIRSNETGKLIVSETFTFFSCSAFLSCSQCVLDYECNWCIFEDRCTGNASSCDASGVIVGQAVSTGLAQRKGKYFCPRIVDNTEILIPADQMNPYEFNVSVASLPVQSGYECVLEHSDWKEEIVTPAVNLTDTVIRCSARKYNYSMNVNNVSTSFSIRWNEGRFKLDNPNGVTVTLYKCGVQRTDCGKCLLADAKFQCGWCEKSAACSMRMPCAPGDDVMGQRWLSGQDLCPDPRIIMFNPMTGHKDGGTQVTIDGFNLGQNESDIKSITIAGMPCMNLVSKYRAAERVVCETMKSSRNANGPIEIMIGRDNTTTMTVSDVNFTFVDPEIFTIEPPIGPQAGRTKMILSGVHLNAGNMRTITVAGSSCDISESANLSSSNFVCYTTPSDVGVTGPVVMTFDQLGKATSSTNFTYMENPTVSMQSRKTTILSGGLDMQVSGRNLDVVQEPMMVFPLGPFPQTARVRRQAEQPTQITTRCTVSSKDSMTCKTPNLMAATSAGAFVFNKTETPPLFVLPKNTFGFVMDGVKIPSKVDFTVYANPEYPKFEEEGNLKEVPFQERTILEIKVRYLEPAYVQGDVQIFVGNRSCILMQHKEKRNTLTCEAPDNTVGQTYDVVVHHGNLRFFPGQVKYLPQQLPLAIIIGAACGGFILVVVLLFIVCIWRRISANERRFKKMEQQRDEMEMRVAQECKEAFAELQISVLNVSSDVEGSGIPFRSYRDYVARVLFPTNPHHPVFNEVPLVKESISGMRRDVIHKGLVQFGNLISNQTFLAIFIRTMESQSKTLSLKDLSHIASLLIIALHNKMDFLTQAVKGLLQVQISKYVKEGRPHMLLRRSEAVVEKLISHWLSILMYDALKTTLGKPLFHLFYAIKQQIDKGPVDVVTGEARYGLSEMKVIRQQIDFKTLTIFANSPDITSEPIQLKVLDCDTISQAKDKILDAIYKSCPFSKRPKRDDLDLEWSDKPGHGSNILLDDDGRGKLDGEWKRFNTLAHYQVPDGATLRLVRAQPNGGSLPCSPAKRYGTLQTSPATSASPIIDQERGITYWHLVKHVDSGSLRKGERDQKMMAEIYLPRLLTTKGTLQQFVDELLETIFNYDSEIPLPVKYLFDFLDEQASTNGITNPDVPHAWKSNSLQLRFWVNLINNPTILFDINKTDTVDAAVTIIGQTLIDACSVTEQTLTKDSPSNKLLYAKDIPQYKQWVMRYYKDISEMASISDQDMNAVLTAHTNRYQKEFQPLNALNELYFCYVCTYKSQILQALDEDKEAQKQGLGDKMEDIFRLMADSA